MARILIVMHLIDLTGFALYKYWTLPTYDRHTGGGRSDKAVLEDYLTQKQYFKSTKGK